MQPDSWLKTLVLAEVAASSELTPRLKILLRIGVIRCREMFRCRREGREFVELKRNEN